MIGRAPQKTIARIRPEFDRAPPRRQVLAGARHQPRLVDGPAIARRRIGHHVAVGRIDGEIVELRDGMYPGGEGRMCRHIRHSLTVQQYRAAITQPAHILVATPSHTVSFLTPLVRATAPPKASTFIGLPSNS